MMAVAVIRRRRENFLKANNLAGGFSRCSTENAKPERREKTHHMKRNGKSSAAINSSGIAAKVAPSARQSEKQRRKRKAGGRGWRNASSGRLIRKWLCSGENSNALNQQWLA